MNGNKATLSYSNRLSLRRKESIIEAYTYTVSPRVIDPSLITGTSWREP